MLDLHRYWESRAATYYVPDVFGREILGTFIKVLKPYPRSFIEIGCGRGELFPLYCFPETIHGQMNPRHIPRVVAADFSENMIKESARRIKRHNYQIELFHLDVTEGHLEEKFDVLMTRTCLMHIRPEDIEAACRNVAEMSDTLLIFEYWEEHLLRELAPHNWLHDYVGLFTALGFEEDDIKIYQRPDLRQVLFTFKR